MGFLLRLMLHLDARPNVSSYEAKNLELQLVMRHKTVFFWLVLLFSLQHLALEAYGASTAAEYTMHIKDVAPNLSYDSNTSLTLRKRRGREGPFLFFM